MRSSRISHKIRNSEEEWPLAKIAKTAKILR